MNPEYIQILSAICLGVGAFFVFTAAMGILRMPDFYTRLHPAGMSDSAGLIMILLGISLQMEPGLLTVKLLLLGLFSLVTSSTACHALAKAALHSGVEPLGGAAEGQGNVRVRVKTPLKKRVASAPVEWEEESALPKRKMARKPTRKQKPAKKTVKTPPTPVQEAAEEAKTVQLTPRPRAVLTEWEEG